ncbi:hypothetical protein FVEN_g3629 [Fusarium venenatum]|nr:hypothetical protein FVEN_g3629 [Fusarium venenatum]
MADLTAFSAQEAIMSQLIFLDGWERSHDKDNEAPQQITELHIVRPYLKNVSLGSAEWDEDKVGRLINQHLLTSMQPPSNAKSTMKESLDTTAATLAEPVTRSPGKSWPKIDGTSTEPVVKGKKRDFGNRIEEISKTKLARHTSKAWSFLRNDPQPIQSVPHCRIGPDDDDLISFENDPDEIKGEPIEASLPLIGQVPVLNAEDVHVDAAPIPEEVETVKCFTCGLSSAKSLIMCPCDHKYCAECLCGMVKSSLRDDIPFPPACCEKPITIDVNAGFFDKNTLCDFFARKFGIAYITPSPKKIPPQVHGVDLGTSKNEGLCYLCKRVNEKDSFCPDCCYRCNRNRTSCPCAANGNAFDPKAPVFRPTNNSNKSGKRDSTLLERAGRAV